MRRFHLHGKGMARPHHLKTYLWNFDNYKWPSTASVPSSTHSPLFLYATLYKNRRVDLGQKSYHSVCLCLWEKPKRRIHCHLLRFYFFVDLSHMPPQYPLGSKKASLLILSPLIIMKFSISPSLSVSLISLTLWHFRYSHFGVKSWWQKLSFCCWAYLLEEWLWAKWTPQFHNQRNYIRRCLHEWNK